MTREWKPGDVAMVTFGFGEKRRAMRDAGGTGWGIVDEVDSLQVQDARPLVVIDSEDREQVERLAREYVITWLGPCEEVSPESVDQMQTALREIVNPPKPDEPTGLGAVVEDAKGDQWVLINVTGPDMQPVRQWRTAWGNRTWAEIDAVRELSPGVPHE